ncbi:ribonuclease domain-containing protein [Deinococcus navajonensis]|uniref:Ribonuclease domain-containing protein n=1 Tax=Deinococcus navajonensis TaxID=309884 RepID=A0ABV8XL90_9DEIO
MSPRPTYVGQRSWLWLLGRLALVLLLGLASCDAPADAGPSSGSVSSARPPVSQAARTGTDPESGLPWIARSALPPEGRQVLARIARGGPFSSSRDGSIFGNRERLLPPATRGHYREYTVPTPGERDRGARRLVCGGQPATRTTECYYTADHYSSFRRVQP